MQDLVFTKLGMAATRLPAYDDTAIPDPHPQGYMYGTNVEGNVAYAAALAGNKAARPDHRRAGDEADRRHRPADERRRQWRSDLHCRRHGHLGEGAGDGSLLTPATQAARTTFDPRGNYGLGMEKAFGGLIGHR